MRMYKLHSDITADESFHSSLPTSQPKLCAQRNPEVLKGALSSNGDRDLPDFANYHIYKKERQPDVPTNPLNPTGFLS